MTASIFRSTPWPKRARLALTMLLICACCPIVWSQAQPKAEIRLPATIDLAKARTEGSLLVSNLLTQVPLADTLTRGTLKIRNGAGESRQVSFTHQIKLQTAGWQSIYKAEGAEAMTLVVSQASGRANDYELSRGTNATPSSIQHLKSAETMVPFAGSDFWVADLGLEFLHWPEQRLINNEMRRGQSCKVLESLNPAPRAGAYSRVVSWIDHETGGIVHADAFDAKGDLLKQFDPKEFKKVEGQWKLSEMEIRNRQTNSRTRIEFELDPSK